MGISVHDLNKYGGAQYAIKSMEAKLTIEEYDDFISVLYSDIDFCVKHIQREKKYLQEGKNGEDRVTSQFRALLTGLGYMAKAEFVGGGNTDITLTSFNGKYEWIGEAKKVTSTNNPHIWGGFLQLVERYDDGEYGYGGIFVYIFAPYAKDIMDSYRDYTSKQPEYSFTYKDCLTRKIGGFYKTHKHTSTGLDYQVRYIPVLLYYNPVK